MDMLVVVCAVVVCIGIFWLGWRTRKYVNFDDICDGCGDDMPSIYSRVGVALVFNGGAKEEFRGRCRVDQIGGRTYVYRVMVGRHLVVASHRCVASFCSDDVSEVRSLD